MIWISSSLAPRLQDSSPRDPEQDPLAGGSVHRDHRVGRQSESQGSLPNVALATLPVVGPLKCLGLAQNERKLEQT